MGRDLDDISVVARDGEEWLRYGTYLLRPASGVPALQPGETAVPIGAEGYATWRRVPAAGQLTVRGATDWKLYAPDWAPVASGQGDTTGVAAEAGGHLVVFGPPSATVTVTLG